MPQYGAFSRDLLDKSQSLRYFLGLRGAWLQKTSAIINLASVAEQAGLNITLLLNFLQTVCTCLCDMAVIKN